MMMLLKLQGGLLQNIGTVQYLLIRATTYRLVLPSQRLAKAQQKVRSGVVLSDPPRSHAMYTQIS
jgi:hypothetical protein